MNNNNNIKSIPNLNLSRSSITRCLEQKVFNKSYSQ